MGTQAGSSIISVPKGCGALSGIGEKFSPDLHTATVSGIDLQQRPFLTRLFGLAGEVKPAMARFALIGSQHQVRSRPFLDLASISQPPD